ncbi:MAG: dhaA [Gammaproteobacteria bacterium]|jgi:haloalkane dehalogenase|nr:dhaA [Gammaproteobacteria bacterium]
MTDEKIKDEFSYESHRVDIDGSKMHYIEEGEGEPILFLHGVPTSSYIWRNIIPFLSSLGRCIALDLMGFGKSDKPNIEYTTFDHIRYVEKFIEKLNLKNIIFVLHGWGSVIGLDYAMRHEKNCRGVAFYESYLRPFTGADRSLPYQMQLLDLQNHHHHYDIVKEGAPFVKTILAQAALHKFTKKQLDAYCAPFLKEGTGKPLAQHLQEIPMTKESTVNQLISRYSTKLTQSTLPKLLMYSLPGFLTPISSVAWAKENLSHLEIVELGEALHFAQEVSPTLMGETISIWLQGIK